MLLDDEGLKRSNRKIHFFDFFLPFFGSLAFVFITSIAAIILAVILIFIIPENGKWSDEILMGVLLIGMTLFRVYYLLMYQKRVTKNDYGKHFNMQIISPVILYAFYLLYIFIIYYFLFRGDGGMIEVWEGDQIGLTYWLTYYFLPICLALPLLIRNAISYRKARHRPEENLYSL